jgi:VWFA-related protein
MRSILPLAIFFTLLCCARAPGQTPVTSPTPPADETDVVKITTALIQLDVTVTDQKGKIVTDLKPDEIEIYENGEKQKITKFSFISNVKTPESGPKPTRNNPGALPPPGMIRPEQVRRTIALVVDDLTLSFESTYYTRRALKKFVDEQMQPGDLVAVIRTGGGIGALQQFTNDKRQLYAAIEKVKWNAVGSGNIGAFAPLDARVAYEDDEANNEDGPRRIRSGEGIDQEFEDFRESLFATGTLGAINYVVRGMQDLPGRKSIMLLSDGFSMVTRDAQGFIQTDRVLQALRRLIDQANRASVVVYTMDARGLPYPGITAADDASGRTQSQLEREFADRRDHLFDTQAGLQYLARQTGGIAIVNDNDLSGGIRRILDDQSYYLVGYEPDDSTFDPKVRRFNRLEVKVKRPGTKVRHRSGFFGVSDERIARPQQTVAQRINYALTSPFALQDITLRLNSLFYNTPKEGTLLRSFVHIRSQDLKFSDMPDGGKKAEFDILAAAFGDNGVVIDQIAKTYTMTLTKERFESLLKYGFVYDFVFPVKKTGAYQLRIVLRDHGSDKIGSANQFVEVPNLKKDRVQLSGVVLDNVSLSDWQNLSAGKPLTGVRLGPLTNTSLRQFRRGTVLSYGFTIYNAKVAPAPNLTSQLTMFRDGKLVFQGKAQPVVPTSDANKVAINFSSALVLGTEMVPGDYVIQVTITDNLRKAKKNTATQFVQFEIVE